MIQFRCRCSETLEVPQELAGTSLQCPNCGLLVDVPTIDDLRGLDDTGTAYRLDDDRDGDAVELAPVAQPHRRATGTGNDTPHITTRGDAHDRRLSLSEFLKIGTTEDDLLEIRQEVKPGVPKHPKYDPETGELVLPLDVRRDPAREAAAVPILAAPAVLGYEANARDGTSSIWSPLVQLFQLPNMIVVVFVAVAHYLNMAATGLLGPWVFPMLLILPVLVFTIAHFANVVDETGPTGTDEIPRPMRSGSLHEDVLRPLLQVVFAYGLAWLPVLLINRYGVALPPVANLGLFALFFALVPALLITLITSGAINNLLPQRALSVIPAAGVAYWVTATVGGVATVMFVLSSLMAISTGNNLYRFFKITSAAAFTPRTMFGLPLLAEVALAPLLVFAATFLLHVFGWQMGLIYRRHHENFAWVLQKHEKTARGDLISQLHAHRQKEMEAKARTARERMTQRAMPIAKPVEPRR